MWPTTSAPYWTAMMSDDKADPITVTLTREEAKCLAGDYIEGFEKDGTPIDFIGLELAAEEKLRAALDSEARPTITEAMVERGAQALWRAYRRAYRTGPTWAEAKRYYESDVKVTRTAARACLQAALGGSDE